MKNTACQSRFPDRATKFLLLGTGVVMTVLFLLPRQVSLNLVSEGQMIENISALFLASAVVVAVLHLKRQPGLVWLSATGTLLWAYLREMDYQKMFTYRSVESLGFYTRPQAPLSEKLLVLLILMPFVAAGAHLLWVLVKSLRTGLANREAWVGQVMAILALIMTGLPAEKFLKEFGQIVEEVAELGLSASVLLLTVNLHRYALRTTPCMSAASPASSFDGLD